MSKPPQFAGFSDRGQVRENNEDRWAADTAVGLFVVADGMGGHLAGELAARVVVETLPDFVRRHFRGWRAMRKRSGPRRLARAVRELSAALHAQSTGQPGFDGMGATVVCALVWHRVALIAHLGDSRAYLLRDGALQQLTEDHSFARLLWRSGEITSDEVLTHPARHRLTQSVGSAENAWPEVRRLRLRAGDRLLLCSDGLSGMVPDEEIQKILGEPGGLDAHCKRLVAAANASGGEDNISVLLLAIESPEDK